MSDATAAKVTLPDLTEVCAGLIVYCVQPAAIGSGFVNRGRSFAAVNVRVIRFTFLLPGCIHACRPNIESNDIELALATKGRPGKNKK